MKKKYLIIVFVLVCLTAVVLLLHYSQPEVRIVGTWQGDGSLELMADAFDGATEIVFYADNRGIVTASSGKAEFEYSFAASPHSDILLVEADELTCALRYSISYDKLILNDVVFIKIN